MNWVCLSSYDVKFTIAGQILSSWNGRVVFCFPSDHPYPAVQSEFARPKFVLMAFSMGWDLLALEFKGWDHISVLKFLSLYLKFKHTPLPLNKRSLSLPLCEHTFLSLDYSLILATKPLSTADHVTPWCHLRSKQRYYTWVWSGVCLNGFEVFRSFW